jgi:hypothetical protein
MIAKYSEVKIVLLGRDGFSKLEDMQLPLVESGSINIPSYERLRVGWDVVEPSRTMTCRKRMFRFLGDYTNKNKYPIFEEL